MLTRLQRLLAKLYEPTDPSLTLRVYSHAIEERTRAAATIMGQVLAAKKEPAAGADHALADGVRPRCPDRALDDPGALYGEDGVEGSRELGAAIADEELRRGTTASLQQLRGERPPTTQDVMRSWGAPNAGGTRAPSVLNVERVPEGSVEFGPLLDAKTAD